MGLIDIHHHIVYGMDDGPKTEDEMYAMLHRAAEEGVVKLFATPHYMPGIEPFDQNLYKARLREARAYLKRSQIALEIVEGAEIFYNPEIAQQYLGDGLPTMGKSSFVLVEFEPIIQYADLARAIGQICSYGYNVILAHVERYRCLALLPRRVHALKERFPVYYQINASSVLEKKGLLLRRFVNRLLKEELVDFVASDAHNSRARPCNMRKAFLKLSERCGAAYAEELFGVGGKSAIEEHD